jgi:hypothetical protein
LTVRSAAASKVTGCDQMSQVHNSTRIAATASPLQ